MHHETRFFEVHPVDCIAETQFCIDFNYQTQFCKAYITYITSETQHDKTYTQNTILWPNSVNPILDISYGPQYFPLQGILASEIKFNKTYTTNTIRVTQLCKLYTGYQLWAPILPSAKNHPFRDPNWQNLHTEYHSCDPVLQFLYWISAMGYCLVPAGDRNLVPSPIHSLA